MACVQGVVKETKKSTDDYTVTNENVPHSFNVLEENFPTAKA